MLRLVALAPAMVLGWATLELRPVDAATEPADAVADSAIGVLTAVSSGDTPTESRFAQTCVVPTTTSN
jgi:hypothetical protein